MVTHYGLATGLGTWWLGTRLGGEEGDTLGLVMGSELGVMLWA